MTIVRLWWIDGVERRKCLLHSQLNVKIENKKKQFVIS